mmetsp:Transcript_39273/g.125230  ORF Transcript_39273/g.125230 Transcript_39273/m.125230 type:complete len:308 (-) Transcript_39273:668-1591(-)
MNAILLDHEISHALRTLCCSRSKKASVMPFATASTASLAALRIRAAVETFTLALTAWLAILNRAFGFLLADGAPADGAPVGASAPPAPPPPLVSSGRPRGSTTGWTWVFLTGFLFPERKPRIPEVRFVTPVTPATAFFTSRRPCTFSEAVFEMLPRRFSIPEPSRPGGEDGPSNALFPFSLSSIPKDSREGGEDGLLPLSLSSTPNPSRAGGDEGSFKARLLVPLSLSRIPEDSRVGGEDGVTPWRRFLTFPEAVLPIDPKRSSMPEEAREGPGGAGAGAGAGSPGGAGGSGCRRSGASFAGSAPGL